ncbi:hypothetical protein CLV51_10857 [Chitinophaga niastensis]|uniref:L,D-transpeptidase-like protein n=1 Tax=Chitinophaga niastensis TaxID=536980 RepID=A0A2P8HAW4_CHINA|nr:hypothetical protein [Chitinophaga niastensis]PSL43368.1 hypothetical protein CLV51_10857 [Chitinophaga niastensis]
MNYLRLPALLGILLWGAAAFAQVPIVTLGPAFEEPGDGWDKLMQLKNGNTIYLHFSKKDGLQVSVYNVQRELAVADTVRGQLWNAGDMESTEIDGIYEINGQPVIFLQQLVKYIPVLYRLVLDGQTGKLIREDKLGELPTIQHRSVFVQDNLASHDCYVEKDPNSDYYAVALFAGGAIQKNDSIHERIQVIHFSPAHEIINKGWFYLQDTSYNYFSYINMTVQGPGKVYLGTVGFNARRKDSEPWSKVIFSVLSPDSATFAHHVLDYTADFGNVSGCIQVASAAEQVRMLLHVPAQQTDGSSGIFMNTFNASSGKLRKHLQLSFPELSKNVQLNLGYKNDYQGTPQRLLLNEDGSSTLLMENLTHFKQGNTQINKLHTNLGDIGISLLDTAGRESMTLAVSKYQVITGICEPFQLQRRNKSEWIFRNKIAALNTNTYLSYDYISVREATFVLFNDYLQYLDTGGQDKVRKPLKYAADANFVCYRFYNGKMERLYLFGVPEVTKGYACMMGASDYNQHSRVYATIMIARKGTEKKACIAWVKF